MRTYRAGLIGCGRIGVGISDSGLSRIRPHADACRRCPRVRLVAACDTDPARLGRAVRRWTIPSAYTDYRRMLETERLDLLIIASSTPTHAPILQAAVSQPGLQGVLLEKPVAASTEEAKDLARRLADSTLLVGLHYGRRFCPVYRRWARAVREGALGRIQNAHGIYTGSILHNGTHLLDLLRWFLGEPDGGLLSWPQGIRVTLEACDPKAFNLFELDLIGTEGRLRFSDLGHRAEHFRTDPRRGLAFRQLASRPRSQVTGLANSALFALKNLLDAVEGRSEVYCSLQDGIRALEWADRLQAAMAGEGLHAVDV